MGDGEDRAFTGPRMSSELWGGALLVLSAGACVWLGVDVVDERAYWLTVAALVVCAGVVVLTVWGRRCHTVSASPAGLHLADARGRERVVPWEAVRRVRGSNEKGSPLVTNTWS